MSIEKEKSAYKKELTEEQIINEFDKIENDLEKIDGEVETYLGPTFDMLLARGVPNIELNRGLMLLSPDGRSFVSGRDYDVLEPEQTKKRLEEAIKEFSEQRGKIEKREEKINDALENLSGKD